MREIKFRAWDEEFKQFNYMDLGIFDAQDWWNLSDPVQQFTGLLDKNGKEIYEGDIYRFYSSTYEEIVTCPIEWMFDPTMLDCNGEVIGNIYENPELLVEN